MNRNDYTDGPGLSWEEIVRRMNRDYYTDGPELYWEDIVRRMDRDKYPDGPELSWEEIARLRNYSHSYVGPSTFNTGPPDYSLESAMRIDWLGAQTSAELGKKLCSRTKAQMLARCYSALQDIDNHWDEVDVTPYLFCSQGSFGPRVEDIMPELTTNYDDFMLWPSKQKGAATLAFVCKEAVMVAVEHPVAGKDCIPSSKSVARNFIVFNSHVIGCVTGEIADCETFLRVLPHQGRAGSAAEVSNWVGDILSSCNLKSLSGILIAGWNETGPSLYCLDSRGKLREGKMFACGSISQHGENILGTKCFLNMQVNEAGKFARLALRTALAHASENGDTGGLVSVYYVGAGGWGEVFGNDGDIVAAGTGQNM